MTGARRTRTSPNCATCCQDVVQAALHEKGPLYKRREDTLQAIRTSRPGAVRMMPGHRYRSRVQRTADGYVLTLTASDGTGGAQAFVTQAEALSGIPALYRAITSHQPPMRGEAMDGPQGRYREARA
jgi:hypothetical protein